MASVVVLDGSRGEGGGQVLRTGMASDSKGGEAWPATTSAFSST